MTTELEKGLAISLHGDEADRALAACRQQLAAWGAVMPRVAPLVLDFGLGDFARTGEIEFWIANEMDAGYCGKYLFVFDGQSCPLHHHKAKHETFFLAAGAVTMTAAGRTFIMHPGDLLPVLPGTVHSFTGNGAALLLELSKPCVIDDNYFDNRRIPIGGNAER